MPWETSQLFGTARHNEHEEWADVYDLWMGISPDLDCLDTLVSLAKGTAGDVLELGAGTGRVAIPLATRGLRVTALDSSPRMLAKLREKLSGQPFGSQVEVVEDDMMTFSLPSEFGLIFAICNSFYLCPTQDDQITALKAARAHLSPGGRIVLEGYVPPSREAFKFGQATNTIHLGSAADPEVRLECSLHSSLEQTVRTNVVRILKSGPQFFPVTYRYVHPSELRLMARIAGLRVSDVWGGWDRKPLSENGTNYIAVLVAD